MRRCMESFRNTKQIQIHIARYYTFRMSVTPAELQTALEEKLRALTASDVRVENLKILAGGASQEMWRLDLHVADHETRGDYQLVLRRQLGGKIYRDALDLAREFRVMQI